jgi:hypothetical protein
MKALRKTIPVIVRELVYSMYFTGSKLCSSSGVKYDIQFGKFFRGVSSENPPTPNASITFKVKCSSTRINLCQPRIRFLQ